MQSEVLIAASVRCQHLYHSVVYIIKSNTSMVVIASRCESRYDFDKIPYPWRTSLFQAVFQKQIKDLKAQLAAMKAKEEQSGQ